MEPRPLCFLLALQLILMRWSILERELIGFGVILTWITILTPTHSNCDHGRLLIHFKATSCI